MRLSIIVFITTLLLTANGCVIRIGSSSFKSTTNLSNTVEEKIQEVDVETSVDFIKINGMQRDTVEVYAIITCHGDNMEEANFRLSKTIIRTDVVDKRLIIRPQFYGGRRSGDHAQLDITVPAHTNIRTTTSTGNQSISATSGMINARASTGNIWVINHSGSSSIQTSTGNIYLEQQSGTFQLRSSTGNTQATMYAGFEGQVELQTSTGKIEFSDPNGKTKFLSKDRTSAQVGSSRQTSSATTSTGNITVNIN